MESGDVIVADREGVAVVPRRHVVEVSESLATPQTYRSLEEYPAEELARKTDQRSRDYQGIFDAYGGRRSPGGSSS